MARINKFQQTTNLGGKAAESVGKSAQAQQAKRVGKVDKADDVDRLDSAGASQRPEQSSPLTETLWKGLSELAQRYYGEGTAKDGLNLLIGSKAAASGPDLDKVVDPSVRDLKASQLARDTGIDKKDARELIDSLALLLAP